MNQSPSEMLFKRVSDHVETTEYLLQQHLHSQQQNGASAYLIRTAIGRLREVQTTTRVALGLSEADAERILSSGPSKPSPSVEEIRPC